MLLRTLILLFLAVFLQHTVRAADLIRIGVSVADDPIRTEFPNGRSFSQNAIASHENHQYVTYWDHDNRLCVARRQLSMGPWEIIRFEDYHILGGDAHETTVLGICPADGTLHLAFDHHNDPLHYRVSVPNVTTDPTSFSWTPALFGPVRSELEGTPISGVTYPRFVTTPSDSLLLWFRVGSSGDGDTQTYHYHPATGGWSHRGLVISRHGYYQGSTSRNAYLNGLHFGPSGSLHVTFCWRETGQVVTNHDINYAWSPNEGIVWYHSQGGALDLPLEVTSPGLIVWPFPMNQGLLNSCAQAVDTAGRIHAVFVHYDTGVYTHFWRDFDGQWQANPIPHSGARPKLAFDSHDDAYVICPGLAILSAQSQTGWTDWKLVNDGWIVESPEPEPAFDVPRWKNEEVLSVYHQQGSQLLVIDFQNAEGILIFRNGFESGDTNSWSTVVPPQ